MLSREESRADSSEGNDSIVKRKRSASVDSCVDSEKRRRAAASLEQGENTAQSELVQANELKNVLTSAEGSQVRAVLAEVHPDAECQYATQCTKPSSMVPAKLPLLTACAEVRPASTVEAQPSLPQSSVLKANIQSIRATRPPAARGEKEALPFALPRPKTPKPSANDATTASHAAETTSAQHFIPIPATAKLTQASKSFVCEATESRSTASDLSSSTPRARSETASAIPQPVIPQVKRGSGKNAPAAEAASSTIIKFEPNEVDYSEQDEQDELIDELSDSPNEFTFSSRQASSKVIGSMTVKKSMPRSAQASMLSTNEAPKSKGANGQEKRASNAADLSPLFLVGIGEKLILSKPDRQTAAPRTLSASSMASQQQPITKLLLKQTASSDILAPTGTKNNPKAVKRCIHQDFRATRDANTFRISSDTGSRPPSSPQSSAATDSSPGRSSSDREMSVESLKQIRRPFAQRRRDDHFYMFAFFGKSNIPRPLIISADDSLPYSLISETLAGALIKAGDATEDEPKERSDSRWIWMDLSWYNDSWPPAQKRPKHHRAFHRTLYRAGRARFLVVSRQDMGDGVILGSKGISDLGLELGFNQNLQTKYLAVTRKSFLGAIRLCVAKPGFEELQREPFKRICHIAQRIAQYRTATPGDRGEHVTPGCDSRGSGQADRGSQNARPMWPDERYSAEELEGRRSPLEPLQQHFSRRR